MPILGRLEETWTRQPELPSRTSLLKVVPSVNGKKYNLGGEGHKPGIKFAKPRDRYLAHVADAVAGTSLATLVCINPNLYNLFIPQDDASVCK